MTAVPRSTPITRIEEDVPLLLEAAPIAGTEDDSAHEHHLRRRREEHLRDRSKALLSVLAMIGLLCVFIFFLSTVLFAVLYIKLLRSDSQNIVWPPPSPSELGQYSTAAVAADNVICSDVGRDVLLKGGNAVDAAVAALFCIGVMDSQSAGLGGGHFMTIFNATTKTCHVVDARETAPGAAYREMYRNRWNASKWGWEALAVPGELHGLWTEYSTFGGRVPWPTLVQPTIDLLENGYPTSHALAHGLQEYRSQILADPALKARFVNPATKDVYKVGEQIKTRQNLAQTLRTLANASDPVKEFYTGFIAERVVEEFKKNKALITAKDLAGYKSIVRHDNDVIHMKLGSRHICGPPPPSGAAVTMGIINVLAGYPAQSPKNLWEYTTIFQRFLEASKFAYAKREELGDSAFIKNATDIARNLTTPEWADFVREHITDGVHNLSYYMQQYAPLDDHGTTSITVIDKEGNAVSVTSTINLILGALVMSDSTGILWNDEMDDFSVPGHPNYFGLPPSPANYIEPYKRPQSSMSPIVVFHEDTNEVLAIGAAGGSTIISGVAGVTYNNLWLGHNIKQAIDLPRLHNQLLPNVTYAESRFPARILEGLEARGQTFQRSDNYSVVTGVHRADDGTINANSDFRKGPESEPAGY